MKQILVPKVIDCPCLQAQNEEFSAVFNLEDYKGGFLFLFLLLFYFYFLCITVVSILPELFLEWECLVYMYLIHKLMSFVFKYLRVYVSTMLLILLL